MANRISLLLISIFFFTSLVHGQSLSNKASKKAKKQANRIGLDSSDFLSQENPFGMSISYFLGYNALQDVEKKTFSHTVALSPSYVLSKFWSLYANVSASHNSYGNNIVRENDSDQFHLLSNLNFGMVHVNRSSKIFRVISDTLNIAIPVSEKSQIDEHKINVNFSNYLETKPWKLLSLFNRAGADYLLQRLKFSRFNDTLNRDLVISESFGLSYSPSQYLGIRASVRLNYERFLDDSADLSFGNQITLLTQVYGAVLFASLINNSYPENETLDIGFYDKYKKLYRLGMVYAF